MTYALVVDPQYYLLPTYLPNYLSSINLTIYLSIYLELPLFCDGPMFAHCSKPPDQTKRLLRIRFDSVHSFIHFISHLLGSRGTRLAIQAAYSVTKSSVKYLCSILLWMHTPIFNYVILDGTIGQNHQCGSNYTLCAASKYFGVLKGSQNGIQ